MAFTRIALGWGVLVLVFLAWDLTALKLQPVSEAPPSPVHSRLLAPLVEGLLLTLFAGLWFGSLGSGGALVLFLVVGLLVELPPRLRRRATEPIAWKAVLASLIRIEAAAVILSFVLSGRIV